MDALNIYPHLFFPTPTQHFNVFSAGGILAAKAVHESSIGFRKNET